MFNGCVSVLLIEDDLTEVEHLKKLLIQGNGRSWQILHYEQLLNSIEHINNIQFDVAVLGLSLPDFQGLEILTHFRRQQATDFPIIVLAEAGEREIALEAIAAGAQDYLFKGQITPEILVRTIHHAIERNQLLHRLKESERQFRGVFEQTSQAINLLSPKGIVLEANQTAIQLSGVDLQSLRDIPIWEMRHWSYSPQVQAQLQLAVREAAGGNLMRFEGQICDAKNQLVWVDFSLKPIKDELGAVVLLIAETCNISERKQAEIETQKALERERELNQMKSSFITTVSHEFRTPMTIISTAVDLLQRFELPPEKKGKYFNQINTSIKTMLQLLDDILLLGKTETGKLQFEPTSLNLKDFCQDIIEVSRLHAGDQYEINFTFEGGSTFVNADPTLLHYILSNLLSNAIKYSLGGGKIWVTVELNDQIAILRIQDQGIGISRADQEQLFEAFYRAENVKHIQGTGLGLTIVKRCVELHEGSIQVDSKEGMGTTVTVYLKIDLV